MAVCSVHVIVCVSVYVSVCVCVCHRVIVCHLPLRLHLEIVQLKLFVLCCWRNSMKKDHMDRRAKKNLGFTIVVLGLFFGAFYKKKRKKRF